MACTNGTPARRAPHSVRACASIIQTQETQRREAASFQRELCTCRQVRQSWRMHGIRYDLGGRCDLGVTNVRYDLPYDWIVVGHGSCTGLAYCCHILDLWERGPFKESAEQARGRASLLFMRGRRGHCFFHHPCGTTQSAQTCAQPEGGRERERLRSCRH